MIEGARRVGKSTILEEFVKNEYKSYIFIRFEKTGPDIKGLFENLDNLDDFFLNLQQLTGSRLYEHQSAIVFDEVQLFPLARQAIKTLVEDGRYDYYETGSLISIKKNVQNILIPSEEDVIYMHPMDFEEFLWAHGDDMTMPLIRDAFERMEPVNDAVHRRIMGMFRRYMLVGGMPQAVQSLLDTNSYAAVESTKRTILNLYYNDSRKLDGSQKAAKASTILRTVASNLERHDKSFSPGLLKENTRMRDYRKAIDDLGESMMVNLCCRVTEPAVDQAAHCDTDDLKIYLCDTGLLFTQSFGTLRYDADEVYRGILGGDLSLNEGMYFENMVAQQLKASGHGLFFAKFQHRDSEKLQEVDFVIVRGRMPTAVEVKSGQKSRSHRSLGRFMDKYGQSLDMPFVVHPRNLDASGDAVYIPIYMVPLLRTASRVIVLALGLLLPVQPRLGLVDPGPVGVRIAPEGDVHGSEEAVHALAHVEGAVAYSVAAGLPAEHHHGVGDHVQEVDVVVDDHP